MWVPYVTPYVGTAKKRWDCGLIKLKAPYIIMITVGSMRKLASYINCLESENIIIFHFPLIICITMRQNVSTMVVDIIHRSGSKSSIASHCAFYLTSAYKTITSSTMTRNFTFKYKLKIPFPDSTGAIRAMLLIKMVVWFLCPKYQNVSFWSQCAGIPTYM